MSAGNVEAFESDEELLDGGRRCTGFDHRLKRYSVLTEVTYCELVFVWYSAISHLANSTGRYREVSGERSGAATFAIEPSFEFHDLSLAITQPSVKL